MTVWGVVTSHEVDYDPEELKRQITSGIKPITIAKNFGVCEATVLKWRKAQGCPMKAPKREITPEIMQLFEELYKKGYTDVEIARKTTHNHQTVILWRRSKGYIKNKTPARITFDQMYGEGCRNYIMLSKATGLSAATMRMWIDKEIRKEASKAENPKAYYRWARAKLRRLNSNRVNQRVMKWAQK